MDFREFKDFVKKYRKPAMICFSVMIAITFSVWIYYFNQPKDALLNDFAAYHYASSHIIRGEIDKLYDKDYILIEGIVGLAVYKDTPNVMIYRYLPTMALYFAPLAFFDLMTAYTIFNLLNFVFNLITIYYVFKIAKLISKIEFEKNALRYYFLFFFGMIFQFENYLQGQVGAVIGVLMVLSMYCYLTKKEFMGSILLGLTFAIKPTNYIVILLILLTSEKLKIFARRIFSMLIPLLPNLIFFIQNPKILSDFIELNILYVMGPNPSPAVGVVTVLINFFGYDKRMIFTVILLGIFLAVSLYYRKKYKFKNNILFSFVFGSIILFISQYDMWSHQLVYLFPFIIIFNLVAKANYKVKLKRYITYMFTVIITLYIITPFLKPIVYAVSIITSYFMIYFYIDLLRQMKEYSRVQVI